MSKWKRFWGLVPMLLLWLFISLILWAWIFGFLTDTAGEQKLSVYFSPSHTVQETALSVKLEAIMPEKIQMVKVKPFTYFMFGTDSLPRGDLYIVKESECVSYCDWFRDVPEKLAEEFRERIYVYKDESTGFTVTGLLPGNRVSEWISSSPELSGDESILFFGNAGLHLKDGASVEAARFLMKNE